MKVMIKRAGLAPIYYEVDSFTIDEKSARMSQNEEYWSMDIENEKILFVILDGNLIWLNPKIRLD